MSDGNLKSRCFRYLWKQISLSTIKKHTTEIAVCSPNGVLQPKGSVCRKSSRTRTVLQPKGTVCRNSSRTRTVLQPKGSVCRNFSRTRTFLPESMRWATRRLRGHLEEDCFLQAIMHFYCTFKCLSQIFMHILLLSCDDLVFKDSDSGPREITHVILKYTFITRVASRAWVRACVCARACVRACVCVCCFL